MVPVWHSGYQYLDSSTLQTSRLQSTTILHTDPTAPGPAQPMETQGGRKAPAIYLSQKCSTFQYFDAALEFTIYRSSLSPWSLKHCKSLKNK